MYCQKQGLQYYEVSAKQNQGVDQVFRDIAKKLPSKNTNRKDNKTLKDKAKEREATASGGCQC